jgi:hypothetical protein
LDLARYNKLSGLQAGIAGEYFVAAELTRRGYIASLTLRNTRGVDILASNLDATASVGIQVKAAQNTRPIWLLNQKVEKQRLAKNLVFVFVLLPPIGSPRFYVVPRRTVAVYARQFHKKWLSELKRDGTPRKNTTMRVFRDLEEEFRNRWDLLQLD